jgi:UDP:flavonoid glycosyltransferase YjiC (YdhE family)
VTPRGIRLAVEKVSGDERYTRRAGELAAWSAEHDAGEIAAVALEALISERTA